MVFSFYVALYIDRVTRIKMENGNFLSRSKIVNPIHVETHHTENVLRTTFYVIVLSHSLVPPRVVERH